MVSEGVGAVEVQMELLSNGVASICVYTEDASATGANIYYSLDTHFICEKNCHFIINYNFSFGFLAIQLTLITFLLMSP